MEYNSATVAESLTLSLLAIAFFLRKEEPATVQPVSDQIVFEAMTVGLEVSTSKTKLFTTSQDPPLGIHTNGDTLERLSPFKYLG